MKTLNLSVSIEQAETIRDSLEMFMRLGLGQFDHITEKAQDHTLAKQNSKSDLRTYLNADEVEQSLSILNDLKALFGHSESSSFGILHPHVDISVKRAYELKNILSESINNVQNPDSPKNTHKLKATDEVPMRTLASE